MKKPSLNLGKSTQCSSPKSRKSSLTSTQANPANHSKRQTKSSKKSLAETPVKRKAKATIRDFGIREGEPIAVVVTLRKQEAIDFLKKVFPVVDNKLSKRSFDVRGNFSFGLKEHIEIPGVKYDPEIGIFGMDICVTVNRPGQRIKLRKRQNTSIGPKHVLTPEESIVFIKQTLGVEIV